MSRRDSERRKAEHGERPNRDAGDPAPAITGEGWRWYWEPGRLMLDRRQNSAGPKGSRVPVALVDVGTRPAPTLTSQSGSQWVVREC